MARFFGRYPSAFAAQFLHACPDHSKIVGGAWSGTLAAQLLHACPDHRKIVSGAGSGHVPSVFLGVMAATKVYSTLLFVVAAIVSILLGFSPKFGALILSTPGPVIEDVDRPESQVRSRLAAGRKWIRTSSSCREAVNRDGRRTGCPEIGTDLLRNRRSRIHLPPAAS